MTELYINNPNEITAVRYIHNSIEVYTKNGALMAASMTKGEYKNFVKKLNIPFLKWTLPKSNTDIQIHFSPNAVSYITQSATYDGIDGLIVGVKGLGRLENNEISTTQSQKIIKAVTSTRKMLSYTPEKAFSRWIDAQSLHIAAEDVTDMYINNGFAPIFVSFGKGLVLDIRGPDVFGLNEADRRLQISQHAENLAAEIATKNGKMERVNDCSLTAYTIPSLLTGVVTFEDSSHYGLNFKTVGGREFDSITLRFNNKAGRDAAIQKLLKKPSAAPKIRRGLK